MRNAGVEIEILIEYMTLLGQGKNTVEARKGLLEEQRAKLLEKQKNITETIERLNYKLKLYDEIIVGTPVWWYTIAPVIRTFLTQNDLSNKTIKPFATNAGWLGHTFQEIQKLCPDSRVDKGMNIVFTEDHHVSQLVTSPDEIDEWIEKL